MKAKVALIAAVAENGVIGTGEDLPWRIKSELKYFMQTTRHKPVIMGRKTFETLGKPLKDRANIIITRDASYKRDGIIVVTSLEKAMDVARKIAEETKAEEIMVGGGAEIYKLALPIADRLYITEVHMKAQGGVTFPAIEKSGWRETKREFHKAAEGESADYTITVLERK